MSYQSESLTEQAREVREASGVSQRALSERAGLTQSHISQIESGKMEPGLSSFIDMTRALDLELCFHPLALTTDTGMHAYTAVTHGNGLQTTADPRCCCRCHLSRGYGA